MAHSQVLHYYNKVGRPLQRVDGPIGALLGKLLLCEVLANIDRDSHDDDKALHDVSVRRVDVHELQSNFHQLEDQHADQDAGTVPTPPVVETPPMVEAAIASSS